MDEIAFKKVPVFADKMPFFIDEIFKMQIMLMLHFITIKNLQEPNNVSIFASEKEKNIARYNRCFVNLE